MDGRTIALVSILCDLLDHEFPAEDIQRKVQEHSIIVTQMMSWRNGLDPIAIVSVSEHLNVHDDYDQIKLSIATPKGQSEIVDYRVVAGVYELFKDRTNIDVN